MTSHNPAASNQRNGVALRNMVFLPTKDEAPNASPNILLGKL